MGTFIVVVFVTIIITSLYGSMRIYNRIKSEQIKISEAKSNIDVYLQQRYDEITALYKIVQEFKLHELEAFKEIIRLRQLATTNEDLSFKEKTKIHNRIEQAMPQLLATFENYPELRSNQNFIQLQEAIENNEANIASSRKNYNSYVNRYNTSISMFPMVLLAKLFSFKSEELYEAPQETKRNPLI